MDVKRLFDFFTNQIKIGGFNLGEKKLVLAYTLDCSQTLNLLEKLIKWGNFLKINKSLLIVTMILASLIILGSASAADIDDIAVADEEVESVSDSLDYQNEDILTDEENPISVSAPQAVYGEDASVEISVANTEILNGNKNVGLYVNGEYLQDIELDDEGKATHTFAAKSLEAGDYNILAKVNGADISSSLTKLTICKATPVISVEDVSVTSGEVITIPFNITDGKGNNITADVIVSIIMEGNSFSKYIPNVTGSVASFDMSSMMAMFAGSGNDSNGTGGFDWASMFGGGNGSSGNGTGGFDWASMFGGGNGSGGMDWASMFGGGNGSNGSSFDMASMMGMMGMGAAPNSFAYVFEEGVYNISVQVLPNRNYNAAVNDTAKLNVVQGDIVNINRLATKIEYKNMTTKTVNVDVDNRTGEYFKFTLKDASGKAIANRTVQIGFNGKVYDRTTDDKGQAKLQINLKAAGTYTFAVAFLGDDAFNGSFVVAKITVKKQTAKLTTSNASYKASAKTKTLKATFKSAKGNPIAGKKVTFTVNGKKYTATTDSKGVAKVKVSLSKKGTYSFTVKYAGDNTYAAVSAKGKLTIK